MYDSTGAVAYRTKMLARAGVKAIWAEKPISLSLAEADEMGGGLPRAEGVALAINCARRWNPFFSEARKLIDEGEIGDVLQVTVYAQCGLSHNGSHAIDILRYMAGGNVEWVFGEMQSDEAAAGESDLMGNGYLVFDNGVRAYLRSTSCGAAPWEVDVIGTTGRIRSVNNAETFELIPYGSGWTAWTRRSCTMSVPMARADARYGSDNRRRSHQRH